MGAELSATQQQLTQELGRLSAFAGFNKAIGQIYALLYLSPQPVSLGEIADQLGISKGNASLNIKTMERWGLVQPISKNGDRRDFYQAETDFWKIVHDILNERDKKEIDHILKSLAQILEKAAEEKNKSERQLYRERLQNMLDFGQAARQMMEAMLNMNNIRNQRMPGYDKLKNTSRRISIDE